MKLINLSIDYNAFNLILDALEYKAHNEAAMSQESDLFHKEETDEWVLAQNLRELSKPVEPPNRKIGMFEVTTK